MSRRTMFEELKKAPPGKIVVWDRQGPKNSIEYQRLADDWKRHTFRLFAAGAKIVCFRVDGGEQSIRVDVRLDEQGHPVSTAPAGARFAGLRFAALAEQKHSAPVREAERIVQELLDYQKAYNEDGGPI